MLGAEAIVLILTGSAGLWLLQVIYKSVYQMLRAKGRVRSEKDALVIARSQWIERYSKLKISVVRQGFEVPEIDTTDEYDKWIEKHVTPLPHA